MRPKLALTALAWLLAAGFSSDAHAVPLVATNGASLTRFDSTALGITTTVPVTGLQVGETIVGIDYRPADAQIYGIGSTSRLYRLNPITGAATQIGTAGQFSLNGTAFGTDVNPVVDRIRSVSNTEQNLRLNPSDGTLSSTDSPLNPAGNVVAAAYTNNFAGATATTLYDIDSAAGTLVIQNPPNTGTLVTVGSLGLGTNLNEAIGFEIAGIDAVAYATITAGGISRLYTVNLSTGAATLVGAIGSGSTPFLGLAAPRPALGFDSGTASASEGGNATLSVSRYGPPTGSLTVDYSAGSGSATSSEDFTPTSGTLSWANGDASPKPITVPIGDDSLSEDAETFDVTLSNPSANGAVLPPATATVTIEASDPPAPPDVTKPALSISAKRSQRLRTVRKRGAAFKATTSEACVLTAYLRLSRRVARRLGVPVRIARKRASLAAGSRALRLKPSRRTARKLRRARKLTATLTASCRDAAGNRGAAKSRKLTLKR